MVGVTVDQGSVLTVGDHWGGVQWRMMSTAIRRRTGTKRKREKR